VRPIREQIILFEGQSFRLLRWNRSVLEVECVLSPDQSVSLAGVGSHWHFHPEMELTLFTSGNGTRFVGDHIGEFQAGDLVLLGANLPHYWHAMGDSTGLSLQWHFPLDHPFWAFPENECNRKLFEQASRGLHLMGNSAGEISRLMMELTQARDTARLGHLFAILGKLLTANAKNRPYLSRQPVFVSAEPHHQQAISKAVRYLVNHFREEILLQDLLQLTALSRPTFSRQFKQHSGRSFSEFVTQLRLQAACRELNETSHSILDVSLNCGFTQISFFNRLFRRELGCSPSQHRRISVPGISASSISE